MRFSRALRPNRNHQPALMHKRKSNAPAESNRTTLGVVKTHNGMTSTGTNKTLTDPGRERTPKGERTAVRAVHQGARQILRDSEKRFSRRACSPRTPRRYENEPAPSPTFKIIGARRGAGSVNTYRVFPGNYAAQLAGATGKRITDIQPSDELHNRRPSFRAVNFLAPKRRKRPPFG